MRFTLPLLTLSLLFPLTFSITSPLERIKDPPSPYLKALGLVPPKINTDKNNNKPHPYFQPPNFVPPDHNTETYDRPPERIQAPNFEPPSFNTDAQEDADSEDHGLELINASGSGPSGYNTGVWDEGLERVKAMGFVPPTFTPGVDDDGDDRRREVDALTRYMRRVTRNRNLDLGFDRREKKVASTGEEVSEEPAKEHMRRMTSNHNSNLRFNRREKPATQANTPTKDVPENSALLSQVYKALGVTNEEGERLHLDEVIPCTEVNCKYWFGDRKDVTRGEVMVMRKIFGESEREGGRNRIE